MLLQDLLILEVFCKPEVVSLGRPGLGFHSWVSFGYICEVEGKSRVRDVVVYCKVEGGIRINRSRLNELSN